jgi:hypothetical protein
MMAKVWKEKWTPRQPFLLDQPATFLDEPDGLTQHKASGSLFFCGFDKVFDKQGELSVISIE